jgi:uncharacterized protein (TIGR02646 family)
MRFVKKQGAGGYHLNQAHTNSPQNNQQAKSRWGSFSYKSEVLANLLEEQYHLCCYSEIRADILKLGYHIEHVQPKSQYPQRTFDYQNLAACALDSKSDLQDFKAQTYEVFGGHAKSSEYDPNLFISCHQPSCINFFAYLSDGRVVPATGLNTGDTNKAIYTIKLLNLNSTYLITLRQSWWNELDDLYTEHQSKNWDVECLVAVDLVPSNGKLSQFFSITRQFFGSIAEEVLQGHALQLV